MKYLALPFLVCVFALVNAQESQLGTTRSEDLQLKARMEYERRNQKQPQSHTTQSKASSVDVNSPNGAPAVSPVATSGGSRKSVICKKGSELRELYVEYKGQGCELFYTKQGATKSQARQNSGKSVCESVFEQIKSTVEKTGFTCEQKEN